MTEATMTKIDHHAAVIALRMRYGRCRKVLASANENAALEALDACQRLLETATPATLGLECVQTFLCHVMTGLTKTRLDGLYHQAVLTFFYSTGIETKGVLSDRLFEKF